METLSSSLTPDPSSFERLHVWIDGELRPPERAVLPVWDHGLLYGDGVFEGVRLRNGALYRIDEHLARLRNSSRFLDLKLQFDEPAILDGIAGTATANGLDDAHVRVIHTRGVGLPGLDPRRCSRTSLLILTYPFPPLLGSEPIALIVSSVIRKAPRSVDAAVKSLNYLDGILAKMQANAAGAGDALMLDAQGYVAEATGTNVFCVTGGVLRTPTLTAALPGITRKTVLDLAEADGIPTRVEVLTPGELYLADEVFLTGTAAGIVPIDSIDGRPLPDAPGTVTKRLDDAYRATWSDPDYSTRIR